MASQEQKFLKQARQGSAVWRVRYRVALVFVALLAAGAAFALWTAWSAGDATDGIFQILLWLGLAAAASIWAVHADLMVGAALHLERLEAPSTSL